MVQGMIVDLHKGDWRVAIIVYEGDLDFSSLNLADRRDIDYAHLSTRIVVKDKSKLNIQVTEIK